MNKSGLSAIVPPVYTGVAFLACWTYLMFYATTAGIEAAAPISLYSAAYYSSAICMTVTLLAISFGNIDRVALLTSSKTKLAIGIGLPTGSMLLISSGPELLLPLVIVGGVLTGVCSGAMLLQWVVAYQRVGLRVAAGSFPMLMAMVVSICATLLYFPRIVLTIATVVFPVISEIMFHEVRKQPWPRFEEEVVDIPNRPINFVLMLLPFAVFALASGFLDYSSDTSNYTFAFYAFGAIIPVIVSGVYLFVVERDSFVIAFLVPLALLVVTCVPFLTSSGFAPFSPFISIGELGIEMLIFIVPIGFATFFSLDVMKTYALGRMVYVLFNAVGWYLAELADSAFEQFVRSQLSLFIIFIGIEVLAVCLIVAIVKAQKNLQIGETLKTAGEGNPADSSGHNLVASAQRVEATPSAGEVRALVKATREEPNIIEADSDAIIAKTCAEFGLSQRESDVCALLARGYTSSRIQKELYIAAGTVNYHSRNIYAKLGVHSKQELIELFEQAAKEAEA